MDTAEVGQLFERYGFLVHRRCSAILRNQADAQDAVQETFWRVSRSGRPANTDATLGWLYSIATHCCFDQRRKHHRETTTDPHALAQSNQASVGAPGDGDRRAAVSAILNQFDRTTREIGVLHHLGGFTQEEIATQTGYSRKTIGKKLAAFEETFVHWWHKATGSTQ